MEPKLAAAIDIGTNSVKMVLGRRNVDGSLDILQDTTEITRLGKGVDASGNLDSDAVVRTLAVLHEFGRIAQAAESSIISAVGTSALRDAANGERFIHQAELVIGGTVEVISGEREADLIFLSALKDPLIQVRMEQTGASLLATTDSGGGSTEIVLRRGMAPVYSESLQLGAVRLTEQVGFSDPPTDTELAEAVVVASTLLQSVPSRAEPLFLVASGGTVANLAAMELATTTPAITADILHGTILTDTQIESRITLLAGMSLSERRHVPGLEPERADVIIAGAIIQLQILRRLQLTELTVSARGLRYGLLYSLLAL